MACSTDFIESVCNLLAPLGDVRIRKMMGDYLIYLNEKCVTTACDNLLYIKKLPVLEDIMSGYETGKPYDGAKDHYILDLNNPSFVRTVISNLWDELPFPKSKKK